jgi:hypothetical protein
LNSFFRHKNYDINARLYQAAESSSDAITNEEGKYKKEIKKEYLQVQSNKIVVTLILRSLYKGQAKNG